MILPLLKASYVPQLNKPHELMYLSFIICNMTISLLLDSVHRFRRKVSFLPPVCISITSAFDDGLCRKILICVMWKRSQPQEDKRSADWHTQVWNWSCLTCKERSKKHWGVKWSGPLVWNCSIEAQITGVFNYLYNAYFEFWLQVAAEGVAAPPVVH